jgi:hypothetical protein
MDSDKMDAFLEDAVGTLSDLWQKACGQRMDSDELADLNDLLDGFFERVLEMQDEPLHVKE